MQAVIAHTRATYAKPRFVVEEEVALFYAPAHKEQVEKTEKPKEGNTPYVQSKTPERDFAQPKQQVYQKREVYEPRERREEKREPRVERSEGVRRDERQLHIRKITDQTPLPPRRFEPKREEPVILKEVTKESVYSENRAIEEAFHKAPLADNKTVYEEKKTQQESPLKSMSVPTFDDKPAISLKEALAKAMSEHDSEKIKEEKIIEDEKVRKEVSEDVLRKLLED
jgi:hypothetical protein